MAKKAATYRLEAESVEWVSSYAEERSKVDGRKVSQADVIEMGIAALRGDVAGGVPDLPNITEDSEAMRVGTPKPRSSAPIDAAAAGRAEHARNIAARQRLLNDAKQRASR